MNDPPQLLRPTPRNASGGQSPTRQRASDDILAQITPATAVNALENPSGALERCLDEASLAEREFAMRTAVASRSIWEWVDELRDWPWPSEGGSSGFERPDGQRRKLFVEVTPPRNQEGDRGYMGSLPAEEVDRFETRIEEIYHEMEDLAVEEIKSHVMTNHIMPLSRPATPMEDMGRLALSYNRMEDLTAVITAIVVQTLPNLARLSRLLQIWSIRVGVLQRIPPLIRAIEDAELALKSGWTAITYKPRNTEGDRETREEEDPPTLSRNDFQVMKMVIDKKVASPGRTLDYMLDRLEGLRDTLPDDWLDRMEEVELGYAEWVAACERKVGQAEWRRKRAEEKAREKAEGKPEAHPIADESVLDESKDEISKVQHQDDPILHHDTSEIQQQEVAEPKYDDVPTIQHQDTSEAQQQDTSNIHHQDIPQVDGARDDVMKLPAPLRTDDAAEPSKQARDARNASGSSNEPLVDVTPPSSSPTEEMPKLHLTIDRPPMDVDETYEDLSPPRIQIPTPIKEERSPSPDKSKSISWAPEDAIDSPEGLSPVVGDDEPELPPLPNEVRRGSNVSQTSTVLHGASSHFGLSSDPPEVSASPEIARARIREAEYVGGSPGASPPSSPPLPESTTRESSLAPGEESPEKRTIEREDSAPPKTPNEESFSEYFEEDSYSISELATPSIRRDSTGDQHLRQQISDIIDGIPAKIKLSTEPPNLNPPDLQLPKLRRKPSKEPFKRSVSSMSNMSAMSTRTTTPSFTLSPAKGTRARSQRGQQEIKVYHLSRSTGEPPIKLFIRCVGENGERVMVRVGGGWADLSEYLKEYASHHARRSKGKGDTKVEVRDAPRGFGEPRSSPPSRPASALETSSASPLTVRKTRRTSGAMGEALRPRPNTPAAPRPPSRLVDEAIPSSEERTTRSRSSSHVSWVDEDSSFLGLAGPSGKKVEMSEENKAWVESVREKVRLASGERKVSGQDEYNRNKFGELGKVGGTKRLFRRADGSIQGQGQSQR